MRKEQDEVNLSDIDANFIISSFKNKERRNNPSMPARPLLPPQEGERLRQENDLLNTTLLLPFLRQLLLSNKLVSWDRPAGRSQETKRPPGTFPPAFYIPRPDGVFPCYKNSYNPLSCDTTPNRYRRVQDKFSHI